MKKKVSLSLLTVVIVLALLSVAQASTQLKWQEVGNGKYDIYENGGFFFIENVDYLNWKSLSNKNLLNSVKPQDAVKQIKFKLSTVKAWKDGKLDTDPAVRMETVFVDSEHKLQFPLKSLWNNNHVALAADTSFGSVFNVEAGGNAFFLYHENGIESVVLPTSEKGKLTLKQLTLDKVNGTSWQQLKSPNTQSERLVWVEKPFASTAGSYVAYKSNKMSYSKGKSEKEIWLVDAKKGTDELLFSGTVTTLYGWVSDDTLVYSLNSKNYLYNVVTHKATPLPDKSNILYVTAGYVAYLLPPDVRQVYLFDAKNLKEYTLPRLPENTKCYNSFYSIFFSLSPDGKKFAVFTQEQYNKGKQAEKSIYILDRGTNKATKVNHPENLKPGETIFHLAQWLDNENLVVYTQRPVESDQGPFEYRTWVVTAQ